MQTSTVFLVYDQQTGNSQCFDNVTSSLRFINLRSATCHTISKTFDNVDLLLHFFIILRANCPTPWTTAVSSLLRLWRRKIQLYLRNSWVDWRFSRSISLSILKRSRWASFRAPTPKFIFVSFISGDQMATGLPAGNSLQL